MDKRMQIEDIYLRLLSKMQKEGLTKIEEDRLSTIMGERIKLLQEDFLVEESDQGNPMFCSLLKKGQGLINGLYYGYSITKENMIRSNIEQMAAHYQSTLEYLEAILDYQEEPSIENLENIEDTFDEASSYLEFYEEKEDKSLEPKKNLR